jgi:nucleotide-binding universal stress UspA family protein
MSTDTEKGEVVVGIDTSRSGRTALKWAADYARSTGRPLHAVHVFHYDPGTPAPWAPGGLPSLTYPAAAEAREMMRSDVQQLFDALPPRPDWQLEICEGPVGRTLVDRAQTADLLVVGTREHTGVDRILSGSVSHHCLSHAQCPVMAVPPTLSVADIPEPVASAPASAG